MKTNKQDMHFRTILELQSYGLMQSEILDLDEDTREGLLSALNEAETVGSSLLDLICSYIPTYKNYARFESQFN